MLWLKHACTEYKKMSKEVDTSYEEHMSEQVDMSDYNTPDYFSCPDCMKRIRKGNGVDFEDREYCLSCGREKIFKDSEKRRLRGY